MKISNLSFREYNNIIIQNIIECIIFMSYTQKCISTNDQDHGILYFILHNIQNNNDIPE